MRARVVRELSAKGISVVAVKLCGLPSLLFAYRLRIGLYLGIAAAFLIPVLSENFVWQIEVEGNKRLTDADVLEILASEGVYEGAYIGGIDPLEAANRCVIASRDISWLAVNIIGNCITVEVIEFSEKELYEKENEPTNVVAKKGGIIKRIELASGVSYVKEGSVVLEGDLLISGVNELRGGGYIYQPAEGKVYAETLNEITVEKSLVGTEKYYTGEKTVEKTIIFFTKSKKLYKDSGNLPSNCDRIERKERVMLFGKIPLPIWIKRVEYSAFEFREKNLTEKEARELAEKEVGELLSKGELVFREDDYTFDGEKVVLTTRYRLVEDIAEAVRLFE